MPSCVWVRVPSLAQKEAVGIPTASFCASSGLPVSFPSVTGVTSPQGEFTSPTFGRSHSHRTADGSLDGLFCASFGPRGFSPLCHWRDFSPGRIHVSDVWSLARSQNSRRLPRPLFRASFRRTPNEGGGLLPPGRAARISLFISDLGVSRVIKTTTLISVKQLIHSNLQVTPQLRRRWRTSHGQMCRTAKSTSKRNRGDAYHIVAAVSQEQKSTDQPSMVLVTVDMFTPIFTSLFPSSKRYGII